MRSAAMLALLFLAGPALAGETSLAEAGASVPEDTLIDLTRLAILWTPAKATDAEQKAAAILAEQLKAIFGREFAIRAGQPGAGGIIVGRRLATEIEAVAPAELEAVGRDGFMVKGSGSRITLAGCRPQGSVYAAYALLRKLGMRIYPWEGGPAAAVFIPPGRRPAKLAPFAIAEKPFFEFRNLRVHLDRGKFGGTIREYALGDPTRAANPELFGPERRDYTKYTFDGSDYVGWFHTAPYLVPRDIYYEKHPEYFAIHRGRRIKPVRYARMAICETNPHALTVARQRAVQWMDMQKDRRFFCVVPADTKLCECERCRASDPLPDYATDRVLRWVNAVASAAKPSHPDKTVLTAAYMQTVKPPLKVRPAHNVVVLYCPWFWDSRASSDVSLDHPLNVTAMKELTAWLMTCPGHVGVYDYPTDAIEGTAARIKLCARYGVRVMHFDGGRGDLFLWLASRLLWDPYQDVQPLVDEFMAGYFGPAGEPMARLHRMKRQAFAVHSAHSRSVFSASRGGDTRVGRAFYAEVRKLLLDAEKALVHADRPLRSRVFGVLCTEWSELMRACHPQTGSAHLRSDAATHKVDLARLMRLWQYRIDSCKPLKVPWHEKHYRRYRKELRKELQLTGPAPEPAAPPRPRVVRFDGKDEPRRWIVDTIREHKALIQPAGRATVPLPTGATLGGVRISAPLGKLPVIDRGNIRMHAGRFYAERKLEKPVDPAGRPFLDVRLHASADVPVSLYLGEVRADFRLHAGEQIIRIDLRNLHPSADTWQGLKPIDLIAIDIYPQDNWYPYPPVRDVAITVASLGSTADRPAPARLPHGGRAIWLSQFRACHRYIPPYTQEQWALLARTRQTGAHDRWLHRKRERFRTFTERRAASPVFAIVTAGDAHEKPGARWMQQQLQRMFGVNLPVDPAGVAAAPGVGNLIVLGKAACLRAGLVTERELQYAGEGGFVINAWQGRVAIAGVDADATADGVAHYLEDHRLRLLSPGRVRVPDLRADLLHELYTIEPCWFSNRPQWEHDWMRADARGAGTAGDANAAVALAKAIKDLARSGKHRLPEGLLIKMGESDLNRHVGVKLMRNPFKDATRLISQFRMPAPR